MDDALVCEEIKRILTEVLDLDVSPKDLDADEPLFPESLGVDSVEALAILAAIERRFGIVIPDAEIGFDLFETVRTLARAVAACVPRPRGAP